MAAAAAAEAEEPEFMLSVWARPPPDVGERLKKLMENLRAEFGGPEFEPHITVVGSMSLTEKDALEKLRSACQRLKPYTCRIHTVSRGHSFFQCIYLLVDSTPEVMEACMHTSRHFGYDRTTPYMPHMSLLYGYLTDEEKEKALERAKSLDPEICSLSFEVSCLTLYESDTDDLTLKSWRKVAEIELTGKDRMGQGSFSNKWSMSQKQQAFHTSKVVLAAAGSRRASLSRSITRPANMNWKPLRNGAYHGLAPRLQFL